MKIGNSNTKISRFSKKFLVFALLALTFFIGLSQFKYQPVQAHNPVAFPKELFSLWNDTAPTINGMVDFTPFDKSGEWSSAAVYNLYDGFEAPDGKLLLQNDNSNLYVGLVIPSLTVEIPSAVWGAIVYLDMGQDGLFNDDDYLLTYVYNNTVESVAFFGYSNGLNDWYLIDGPGLPGATLPITGMVGDSYFGKSNFDNTTAHRQYEFKLPYQSGLNNDEIIGIGFLATDDYLDMTKGKTWPYVGSKPGVIDTSPGYWGDLHLGTIAGTVDYVIEDNFQIYNGKVGPNNGTFITTGDIDGDGDLEIIASSNRSVVAEPPAMAIFDYDEINGEIVTMWESWTSTHSSMMIKAEGIKCYDFDGDGEDEIFAVSSESSYILRLSGWSDLTDDFVDAEYIFDNTDNLMGYIDIGDVQNLWDGSQQIIFGDSVGWIGIIEYTVAKKWNLVTYLIPPDINGTTPTRIHDIEIAEADDDSYGYEEFLLFSQITADDSLSTTRLQIFEGDDTTFYDNPTDQGIYHEDDLQIDSHINTQDSFGHTIVCEDVDNDGITETIIVGKDYLKIFGRFTFNDSQIPLVFNLTDGTSPNMGGGAAVFDIDGDSDNELIFGHSNGTVFIYEIIDNNSDPDIEDLSYVLEWKGDLGTSPGKRNSIVGLDIDEDGDTEAIITDNFGQIIVLGKGTNPELTITSPTPSYVSNQPTVLVTWETSNDTLPMYYYDIFVDSLPVGTAGGGQTGFVVPLNPGSNVIEIYGYDITGKLAFDTVTVNYIAGAPEVTIYSPVNDFMTSNDQVVVNYTAIDPQGDPIDYYIYVNGTSQYGPGTDTYKVVSLSLGDGIYNITVVAVDTNTGDTGRSTVFVTLDTTIPYVKITSPADGSAVSASQITLNWDANDDTTGIYYFEVWRDSDYLGITYSYSMSVNLTFNLEYLLRVRAYDNVGNYNESTISVIRDSIEPTITLTDPSLPTSSEGWYMTENHLLPIEWTGEDNVGGSGIDYFEVTINGGFYGIYDEFTTSDTIDLGSEGMKEVAVYIYDFAGNLDFDYFQVALDTSNPFVNITSPENNHITSSDTINIFWDSTDDGTGVKEHIIYIDGSPYVTLTDPSIKSYEVPITFNDTTVITVRAIDYLDKYTDDSIDIIHDPESPTFNINSPLELYSYSNTPLVNLTWFIKKITVEEFQIYVDGSYYNTYTNTTTSALVDLEFLEPIAEGTYPTFNITILVWDGFAYTYEDHCFITVDMTPPTVSILNPAINYDIITVENMRVSWSAFDAGSSISGYDVWLNGDLVGSWDSTTTEQYIDITGYPDGEHNITVMAFDVAGNNNTYIRTVLLYPFAPEFETDLPEDVITNNADFQFNLSITNPRLGVEEIEVVADSEVVIFSVNYNGSAITVPFSLPIDVEEIDFVSSGVHNLTITVYDSEGRASNLVIDVIIDKEDPELFGFVLMDDGVLYPSNEFLIYEGTGTNNHSLSITFEDPNGIAGVQVNILGDGIDNWYSMQFDPTQSTGDLYAFKIIVNLDSYIEGNYSLRFVASDLAGNEVNVTFGLTLTLFIESTGTPAGPLDMQTIIIIAASGGGIVLIILLSVIISIATKKQRLNKNWEKDMHAVAYVTKTGLTLAYVPYTRDMFEDEQLFGGAMTGIMSILGEITGETDVEMKVNVIEFGDKQLVVCPGFFGKAILLVNDVKPIMKDLVVRFVVDFELTYKHNLTQDLIDLNEFSAVPLMVEGIFGVRTAFL